MKKVRTATSERFDLRARPISMWPDVQPLASWSGGSRIECQRRGFNF